MAKKRVVMQSFPRGKVLVVDDDRAMRVVLESAFLSEGYEVFRAENGADALGLLNFGLRPAALILDLMMPVANGFDLLAALKAEPRLQCPVVVLSASAGYTAHDLGVAVVLRKPAGLDEILAAVERARRPEARSDFLYGSEGHI